MTALGAAPSAPTSLRVNDVANPVGIGAQPYFAWLVNDPDSNEIQTRYQILVATEKGGFLGDAFIQSAAAMSAHGERVLTRQVLGEFLQSMTQFWSVAAESRRMNAVYPNVDGKCDIPDYTQCYLPWVWDYYLQTGDKPFLTANYAQLKSIAEYVHRSRNATTGLITDLPGGSGAYQSGIIDWPATMRFGHDMTAARAVINA